MTKIIGSVKFDQGLWDARSAGYRADEDTANPYIVSSSDWAAWEAGRAFGLGRVAQARGLYLNVQMDHGTYRIHFDELSAAPRAVRSVTYCHGTRHLTA